MARGRFQTFALPFFSLLAAALLAAAAYGTHAAADPATAASAIEPEYALYTNNRWHYSLAVPASMIVSEHEREGGGQTVQFMDPTVGRELLISAWPYTHLDLTLAREGTPSTHADQPDHLEIVEMLRHDTVSVLFQKNGVRYFVVTLPGHEAWLTDILTTWRFID